MNAPLPALAPGIHDMPETQYHADPARLPSLSNSVIKVLLGKSPRHAWMAHPRLNPLHDAGHKSAFDFGTAAHARLLEGRDICTVVHASDWRTKAAQTARAEAQLAGQVALLADQYERLMAMTEAAKKFLRSSGLGHVLTTGKAEQTIVWQDGATWCRGRLDLLDRGKQPLVLDYKTTDVLNPDKWIRGMIDLGYDTQSVFYRRGLRRLGIERPRFVFLVQEVSPPFCCYLVELAESMEQLARMKVDRAINLWGQCVESDTWPAYSEDVHMAEAPPWALANEGITE